MFPQKNMSLMNLWWLLQLCNSDSWTKGDADEENVPKFCLFRKNRKSALTFCANEGNVSVVK